MVAFGIHAYDQCAILLILVLMEKQNFKLLLLFLFPERIK